MSETANGVVVGKVAEYRGVSAWVELEDSDAMPESYVAVTLHVEAARLPGGLSSTPYRVDIRAAVPTDRADR